MEQKFFFQLLKNIMLNAFQTETRYLKSPYEKILNTPSEFLNTIFPDNLQNDERIFPSNKTPMRCLFVIKTNLLFYNIHFCLNSEPNSDIISIGPFRSDNISLEEFLAELDNIPFGASKHSLCLNYYQNLPCVSLQNITNTICYLLNTCVLFPETISPTYVDYTTINNGLFDAETISNTNTALTREQAKINQERLTALSKAIIDGNPKLAEEEMNLLLKTQTLL